MNEEDTVTLTEGYTAGQAAVILARNSGRDENNPKELKALADLVKKLGHNGVIRLIKVNNRLNLYNKEDVNNYKVEERGVKSGRAARARAKGKQAA